MNRLPFLGFAMLLIVVGLLLRLVPWGLPLWAHRYGGGFLWGAMVFLLVATLRPPGWGLVATLAAASAIAATAEVFRLYHTPGLDGFRVTLAGQLLLERIFSIWNILVYALGIAAAAGLTWRRR